MVLGPPVGAHGKALMASRGKKKTTMAKLNREAKLRERKRDKQARKEARKQAAAAGRAPSLEEPPA
jgi:hypothetical protein